MEQGPAPVRETPRRGEQVTDCQGTGRREGGGSQPAPRHPELRRAGERIDGRWRDGHGERVESVCRELRGLRSVRGWFVIDSDTQLRFTAPAYDPSIRSDPATAKGSAGNNSMMSATDQFPEWTWGGQTRAGLQAQTN